MKRVLVFLTAALLILSLASCGDKADSIKKAFEKANYDVASVSGSDKEAKALFAILGLSEEQEKELEKCELIVCNKKTEQSTQGGLLGIIGGVVDGVIPDAIIIKFPSANALKDFLIIVDEDGTKITTLYEEAQNEGLINGNCLLTICGDVEKDIFK